MKKHAYTLQEVSHLTGISKSKLYQEISASKLTARKVCSRTVILDSDLNEYLSSLPEYTAKLAVTS